MKYQDLKITANPALVRDHALDKLRNAISSGLYPPGKRLIERELCEALGVSRTSVREALRQLQSENLIEIGQRRTLRVAVISAEDASDVYLVRMKVETEAVKRFVELGDKTALKALVRVHKEIHKQLHKGDLLELSLAASEFYETILANCGSKVIYDIARQLLVRVQYLRYRSMSMPGRLDAGMDEWDRLMDAITAGDADGAAKAMTQHLVNARAAAVATLEVNPLEAEAAGEM
ncbi:GntR family transcriptional regulator [Teredinibacter turnerae]|uniref:GntR family transcriptional regulator n=1 Tax=Teredinibacter turnerae TaxID=2426 RepID=UPI00036ABA69|nr:GntR family transcriptional regulator [Teredinibacter turnerae]